MKRLLIAFILLIGASFPAYAQISPSCYTTNGTNCIPVGTSTPAPITGSSNVVTYSAGSSNANTGAGDIYCISGSATKLVKVKVVRINAIANAATVVDVKLIKRSSADTGGTSTTVAVTPNDSLNPIATATVTTYSVSPTPGTTVGVVRARKLAVGTTGNSNTIGDEAFNFYGYYDQPLVLRGTSQFLCVNVTALGAGASINIGHEHTEE